MAVSVHLLILILPDLLSTSCLIHRFCHRVPGYSPAMRALFHQKESVTSEATSPHRVAMEIQNFCTDAESVKSYSDVILIAGILSYTPPELIICYALNTFVQHIVH